MTISGSSPTYQSPAAAEASRAVMVLKKQQDMTKDVGQAMLGLIEQSSPSVAPGRIDVYA
jgi:hypothetical protein